jgi:spore maturation protein CgeB
MRILQLIDASTNASIPGNQTWYRNLYEPLLEMGHEVLLMPTHEKGKPIRDPEARERLSQRLWDTFQSEQSARPFQLFFAYLMDGMVDPAVIDRIRAAGVPTCNFSCNNTHQFDLVDEISPHFDFNLHAEKDVRDKFLAVGANPLWWPMASNPKYFHPVDLPRSVAASFVGENYALRARYIGYLLENGVDVHAYGPRWQYGTTSRWRSWAKRAKYLALSVLSANPQAQMRASANLSDHDYRRYLSARFPKNVHQPVSDEELIALYSRSQVSLGFLEVYHQHDAGQPVVRHLHLREFEAPMCAALYCTGYSDELAEFFDPDREVITYRNQYELLDKVNYYLAHPQQADQLRRAGHQRALKDHTYLRRYQQLFEALGLH